jgi:toxin-antitoxin system PIN domain toxin
VKAVDTNVLVYAEITSSPFHETARAVLRDLAEGAEAWALPWPCAYEFLRVVTHPRVYHPPVPTPVALADLLAILASPSLTMLGESDRHVAVLESVVARSGVTGNLVFDAHIVALCVEHGVSTLVTGDLDFLRFDGIAVENPFESPS